jgi:hypothetical protein
VEAPREVLARQQVPAVEGLVVLEADQGYLEGQRRLRKMSSDKTCAEEK